MPPSLNRPRSFAERPNAMVTLRKPANENAKGILGVWEDGSFHFNSPAAEEQWVRNAYKVGVNPATWQHGKEVDERTADIARADLGGPLPGMFLGPDGKYRAINAKTIEAPETRAHRSQHFRGKTIDQLAAAKMPGEDEWVERWKAGRIANENVSSSAGSASFGAEPNQVEKLFQGLAVAPGRSAAMKRVIDAKNAAKRDVQKPAGKWVGGSFIFDSLEDHQRWARASYRQGVNEDTWHLGTVVDPNFVSDSTPNPGLFRAPDGTYRLMNNQTIESDAARDHRNRYLTGKTIDNMVDRDSMPGEDEWVEKWTSAWDEGRPNFGTRFEASAKRAFIDNTAFGTSLQAFKSGHARSPDVLANRPPDRFLQSGSKGAADWYRMYEPLGIAGGKRRIDFLSPEEGKQWQTEWEALSAEQQAAYRLMWEEKQREFILWRAQIDREIYLPSPETKAEHVVDFVGGTIGSMASPENWIGSEVGAAASTLRSRTLLTAEEALVVARNVDSLAGGVGETTSDLAMSASAKKLDDLTEGANLDSLVLDNTSSKTASTLSDVAPSLRADLEAAKKKFYTLKEAYNLPEPHRGIVYVKEKALSGAKWVEFMKGHPDAIWLPETQEFAVPAIRYVNPNTNGKHLIRLDAGGLFDDLETAVLTDSKTQMAVWAKVSVRGTLLRLREALRQNPGYGKVIYEVETEAAGQKARHFIESNGFTDIVIVKVRQQ